MRFFIFFFRGIIFAADSLHAFSKWVYAVLVEILSEKLCSVSNRMFTFVIKSFLMSALLFRCAQS